MIKVKDQIKSCVKLLEFSTLGVITLDLESKEICFANRKAKEILGISPVGRKVTEFVPDGKNKQALLDAIKMREQGKSSNEYTLEICPPDKECKKPKRISVAGVPISDEQGTPRFSFVVLRDLTLEDTERTIRDIIECETDYKVMMNRIAKELYEVFPFDFLSLVQYSAQSEVKGDAPRHVRSLFDYCSIEGIPDDLRPPAETYKVWYYLPPSPEMAQLALDHEITHFDLSVLLEHKAFSVFLEDPFVKALLKGGYLSSLRIPVFEGEQLVAALFLHRHGKDAFKNEDLEIINNHLRLRPAIRAAYSLYQNAENTFRMCLRQKLSACNKTDEIAEMLVNELQRQYNWKHVSVFRVEHAQRRLRLLRQAPSFIPDDYNQDIGAGVMGYVLEHEPDKGIKIDDIDALIHEGLYIALPDRDRAQTSKMTSEMCIPVAWGGAVRWLVNLEDPRQCAFSDEEFTSLRELLSETGQQVETMAERLRSAEVFESSHDALFIVDEDNHISRMNSAAAELLGADAKDRYLDAFLPGNAKSSVILEGGAFYSTETTIRSSDGIETKVLISGTASPPDIPGRLFVAKNLRAYERTEELKALGQVFYEVAMQTQTPLSLAASGLHRLATGVLEGEDPASLAERILPELNKIELTLEKMSLYHEGNSDVPVQPIVTDLRHQVERIRHGFPEADQKRVSITGAEDLYTLADPFRTEFVLRSLLAYLVEYSAGSRDVSIELAERDDFGIVKFGGYVCGDQRLSSDDERLITRLRAYLALSEPLIRKFIEYQQNGLFEKHVTDDGQMSFTVGLPIAEEA